jgi:hypothetical protein
MDEGFLLKEIQLLRGELRGKKVEESSKILEEEAALCSKLREEYEGLKGEAEKLVRSININEKVVFGAYPEIGKEIVELMKKYTEQEVALLRGLQEDADGRMTRTNAFGGAREGAEGERVAKHPKSQCVKVAKELLKREFKVRDTFEEVKRSIALTTPDTLKELETEMKAEPKGTQKFK